MNTILELQIKIRIALAAALLVAALAAPAAAQDIAIRGATILTVTRGTIENGTVVVRNGRITAVGQNVAIPAGVRVIDGTGRYVMPGIVDAHSHMAMDRGVNEGTDAVTPEVVVQIRHDDPQLYRALAGGVTTINVLHGSANVIGGQNATLKLRWGQPVEDLYFQSAPRGIKFALGENVVRANRPNVPGQQPRFPTSRMGVEHTLRWWFTQAQEYREEWDRYERESRRNRNLVPPRRDLRLEALADILRGRILVHAHSYRADEILMLLRVAEDFGFKIHSLQHVLEGYKVADEIAAHGAGASTFADNWAYKVEAWDAIPHNPALMAERGVSVSINSDSGERVRRLYQEAAKAVKYGGASEEEALAMITINPARHLGVQDRVGSIEVGKDADLAIFNGHPFAPASRVEMTLVDGRVYFDRAQAMTLEKLLGQGTAAAEVQR
ncbi:MAG TPA: amidohydrolase [Longimicrobiaceae bacterium]|nr:amidohydrolase [Longimicrobiaceae bacterium]